MNRNDLLDIGKLAFAAVLAASVPGLAHAGDPPAPSASSGTAATASAKIDVMMLHATAEEPGSIDPRIDEGHPRGQGPSAQLTKPPFSAYKTYRLKDRKALVLEKGKPTSTTLPNGRTLQVTLSDVVVDKGEKRYRLSASISQPSGPAYLPLLEVTASPGKTFFVAGQAYDKGSLVLAFTVK